MIRAMWAEAKRTFRVPQAPWEEWWWNDEFLATGQWVGLAAAFLVLFGGLLLFRFPSGAGAFGIVAAAGGAYTVALLGVAAWLRTR